MSAQQNLPPSTYSPSKFELPTIFVIFGITGDLSRNRIIKSLYALHRKNLLPKKFQIYGFSRRELDDEGIRNYVKELMEHGNYPDQEKYDSFVQAFYYVSGNFDAKDSYTKLAEVLGRVDDHWKICSNKLFYLAVPPQNYRHIIDNLHDSGLTIPCSPEEGWTRVILEKPFGTDLQSAKDLDARLGELFKEEQIYRVDHYLAKQTVRNILAFRFSNSLLTPAWNNKSIEKIEIKVFEEVAVTKRGEFFDKVGALRDVGQNHMLQLLALFTMENPGSFSPNEIRQQRAKALQQLKKFSLEDVKNFTVRGQYEGYQDIEGVHQDSQTETYFKIKTESENYNFADIPIYLESGKALKDLTEIRITFKHSTPCLCPTNKHTQNVLRYIIDPDEKILASFLVKQPGYDFSIEEQNFEFDYHKAYNQDNPIFDYEQLLMDIIKGDQTLFVTTEEIVSEWEFVEPILKGWHEVHQPLLKYKPGEEFSPKVEDDQKLPLATEIGIIGLGKMGAGLAQNLQEKGWTVYAYNRSHEKTDALKDKGILPVYSIENLVKSLKTPRIIWIMLTAGQPVDDAIFGENGVLQYLQEGDIIVDGGNSNYKDALRREKEITKKGVKFVDVGFSGGPKGARTGGCLMVGGDTKTFEHMKSLYKDISIEHGFQHFEGVGAGHFVKMVHNGIEYGMMQAIAEGTHILKKSSYNLDLTKVADIYNNGSVIESRLIAWLYDAFQQYGKELEEVSGVVAHTGEGAWTVDAAKELGVEAKVIEDSLQFRINSANNPNYTGKVLSALRNMFGGHAIKGK
jgi:glucose-6-phosphate 1-dehydrogenase